MNAVGPERPTSGRYPSTLGELISEIGRQYGNKPALVIKPGMRTRYTSYAALERDAGRVARMLQQRGVVKGDRVLIWAPNMPAWVTAFFGVQRAGAILVPLDVRSSPELVMSVVRQTEPTIAMLSRATAAHAAGIGAPYVLLDELEAALPEDAGQEVMVAPDDIAEIMFTSGTTGDPKGVMLTHQNILANVRGADVVLAVNDRFRFLSLLPLSHMFEQSVGMLAPLAGGARIVYPVSRQPSILMRTLQDYSITTLVVVPQILQLLLAGIERQAERTGRQAQLAQAFAIADRLPRSLRRMLFRSVHARLGGALELVLSGGAALDPALARQWERMGVIVLQGYGATEAAPIITGDRPRQRKPGAVGLAYPGVQVRIAADGEILARGANIFPGYWRNPEATARVLNDGWYHTGDLGEVDEDGYLQLKGRKKDMIVLANGQNVFPEDVERALSRQPGIREAVVVGRPRSGGNVEVHAVLLMEDASHAAAAVEAANRELADHQHIQGWTVWPHEDLPRTHTLKVKKHEVLAALSAIADGKPAQVEGAPAPSAMTDPLPRIIAAACSVAIEDIRPDSRLGNDLHLDSLGRVEMLSAIEEELGAYLDEATISAATTVTEIERMIAAAPRTRDGVGIPTWPHSPTVGFLRELALQALVFPFYRLFYAIRVEEQLHAAAVHGPAIIAVNHNFGVGTVGLDPPAAWLALPLRRRLRTATAGEEHAVFDPVIKGRIARFFNCFPLSKEGNVRGTLEQIGRLLDGNWSVLIFPEGKLTVGGPIQPFMRGTGLIAVEAQTPVIPLRIVVERSSILEGLRWPIRGALRMRFGEALWFAPGTDYEVATERIEHAIRNLAMEESELG